MNVAASTVDGLIGSLNVADRVAARSTSPEPSTGTLDTTNGRSLTTLVSVPVPVPVSVPVAVPLSLPVSLSRNSTTWRPQAGSVAKRAHTRTVLRRIIWRSQE